MTRTLTKAEAREYAAQVAAELGLRLAGEHAWGYSITAPDGHGYYLHEDAGRILVSGLFPQTGYYFTAGDRDHITVAVTRGPAVVAKEIRRRLEPRYYSVLAKVAEYDKREHDEQAERAALAERITSLFGTRPDTWGDRVPVARMNKHAQSSYRTEIDISGPGYQGGDVKFSGSGAEVELDRFKVPPDVAVAMLAVYAEHLAKGGG